MIEIERKFLVENPPENYTTWPASKIRQGYIAITEKDKEVRIRQKENRYFQTVKSGIGLVRHEIEIELTHEQFEALWPSTQGKRIEKIRYYKDWGNFTIELDIFLGSLDGLCTAEIELTNMDDNNNLILPDWFGQEITEDEHYKNRNLAQ